MSKNYKSRKYSKKFLFFILISLSLIKSTNSNCNEVNCLPTRGMCFNNRCICNQNYITTDNKVLENNGIFCNYELKARFIAFLLEFFFPFGVGHFYSGKIYLAIIKLSLFAIMICSCCCVLCCVVGKEAGSLSLIVCIIIVLSIIVLVVMEIFDLIGYGLGIYKDGNGYEMY